MKITDSAVTLSSSHQSLAVHQQTSIWGLRMKKSEWEASQNGLFDEPDNPSSAGSKKQEDQAAVVNLSDQGRKILRAASEQPSSTLQAQSDPPPQKTMSTLRALLQYLKSISSDPKAYENLEEFLDKQEALAQNTKSSGQDPMQMMAMSGGFGAKREETVLVDRRETFDAESEYTSFSAQGIARAEDGRKLSFNVDVAMSREFMRYTRIDERYEPEPLHNVCDPLVINVDASTAGVSDQKFTFDLDADGTDDSISLLKGGSGFLALDKNDNGRIDDGNELFGTSSGNGFIDLAKYDQDHNNWIDENDDVFSRLKIWYKDEDGTDKLMDLKSADVGAIYLGNASTEFSLKDSSNQATNGMIRSSGVFLRESGGAGTIQHLDLAL